MIKISPEEERERDWDWYAVDPLGCICHFTTAGLRTLPPNVKRDREGALRLIAFFEGLPPTSRAEVSSSERVKKGLAEARDKERFLRSFVAAASRGLYSYDTDMIVAEYFLVAAPKVPLRFDALPKEIQHLLHVRTDRAFADLPVASEKITLDW